MGNEKPRCSNTNPLSQGQGDQPYCASLKIHPGKEKLHWKKLEWKGMKQFQKILILIWVTRIMIWKIINEFYWLLILISLLSHLVIWSPWWVGFLQVFKNLKCILCIYLAVLGLRSRYFLFWHKVDFHLIHHFLPNKHLACQVHWLHVDLVTTKCLGVLGTVMGLFYLLVKFFNV